MSEAAKTLFFFLNNCDGCADDSDRQYCFDRARVWAAAIIAGEI